MISKAQRYFALSKQVAYFIDAHPAQALSYLWLIRYHDACVRPRFWMFARRASIVLGIVYLTPLSRASYHEAVAEREFVVPLDLDARVRMWHRIERRQVRAFTIQLEVLFEERWTPVVRYDTAYGFAHRDLYRKDGKQFKTLLDMDFNWARTFAQKDVLMNWQEYRRVFLEG